MSKPLTIEWDREDLKKVLERVGGVVSEKNILFNPLLFTVDGQILRVMQIGLGNNGAVKAEIHPKSITGGEDKMKFAIDPARLHLALKEDATQLVTLKIDENKLEARTSVSRYEMMLEDKTLVKEAFPDVDESKFLFDAVVPAAELQKVFKQMGSFSLKDVVFRMRNKKIEASVGDVLTSKVKADRKLAGIINFTTPSEESCEVKFSDRLGEIVGILAGDVHVAFKSEFPILIRLEEENLKVRYVFAPMIDDPNRRAEIENEQKKAQASVKKAAPDKIVEEKRAKEEVDDWA